MNPIVLKVAAKSFVLVLLFSSFAISQYRNIRIDKASDRWQPQEVSIAINPVNPLNLIVGSNKQYYYYSFDGGNTWTGGTITSRFGMCGDPVVVFDAEGRAYFGHIAEPSTYWPDRIVVHRSLDGGRTWTHEVGIGYIPGKVQDKEWLAVDVTGSRYRGNIYVAWTHFDKYNSTNPADKTYIRFSRSTDKGETFSTPVQISDIYGDCIDGDNALQGAVPAAGPNGEVYIAWAGYEKIYFDKSLDGGVTFGTDIVAATQPGGWCFDIPGVYRCNGMPVTCCDISNSPWRGTVYINWADQRNGVSNTDIFLTKSTDGGETWSPPKKVNDDNSGRHQFFTWMCIDQVSGYLYVVFYDRRATTGNATDVYVARSKDGGETFENFKVSESSFTPTGTVFFGDYTNIAAKNGKIYATWMRMDGTTLSIWMTEINDPVPIYYGAGTDGIGAHGEFISSSVNPATGVSTFSFSLSKPSTVSVSLFNLKGAAVATIRRNAFMDAGVNTVSWHSDAIGSGVYLYGITINGYSSWARVVIRK